MFQPADGFPPKWDRQTAALPSSVYGAYCCCGVTVLAQAVGEGDRLVLMAPDLVTRSKRKREMHQARRWWWWWWGGIGSCFLILLRLVEVVVVVVAVRSLFFMFGDCLLPWMVVGDGGCSWSLFAVARRFFILCVHVKGVERGKRRRANHGAPPPRA